MKYAEMLQMINTEIRTLEDRANLLRQGAKYLTVLNGTGTGVGTSTKAQGKGKRHLSAQAIASIRKAQHKRWAKYGKTHPKKAA